MKRFSALFLLCFLLWMPVFAQQPTVVLPVEVAMPDQLRMFHSKLGSETACLLVQGNQATFFLLGPDASIQLEISDLYFQDLANMDIQGISMDADRVGVHTWDPVQETFRSWHFSTVTTQAPRSFQPTGRNSFRRGLSESFSHGGVLHVLRLSANGQQLKLCKFQPTGGFTTLTYDIDHPEFLSKAGYAFQLYDPTRPQEWLGHSGSASMYQEEGSILMTLEEPDGIRWVRIDLASGEKEEGMISSFGESHRQMTSFRIQGGWILAEISSEQADIYRVGDLSPEQAELLAVLWSEQPPSNWLDMRGNRTEASWDTGEAFPQNWSLEVVSFSPGTWELRLSAVLSIEGGGNGYGLQRAQYQYLPIMVDEQTWEQVESGAAIQPISTIGSDSFRTSEQGVSQYLNIGGKWVRGVYDRALGGFVLKPVD
ncbi:hypothetical protein [Pontibacter sp. G13]|uniref:hypothetical protein n=1 Tax=Pontibacter sp. G13 TaxID=3074898 RepID=UPI00288BF300|nr:hypothetical protein [Pontibacter sp. G13]WNJ21504.1 hypothetical protein RJD25_13625 [Pontibacter sp. G13]